MGRGLGKIQRTILHMLSQYPTGLSFSELKRMVPEDISKTKGLVPRYSRYFFRKPSDFPQRKFDHNIYMALKALAKRSLIEIDPPYRVWSRVYRITQKGIDYVNNHPIDNHPVHLINIKITSKEIVEEKSLYEIMEKQALNNAFNLEKLLEMGYSINEIAITASPLVFQRGILNHKHWEEILEVWHKQWE